MKNFTTRFIFIAVCVAMLAFVACNKKTDDTAKSDAPAAAQDDAAKSDKDAAAPQVPADPDIDPKAIIGTWKQTCDDPDVYTFTEDGKCSLKNVSSKSSKECTYELQTPAKANSRFNMLIVRYPAVGEEEAYENHIKVRISGDKLETPYDDEGNVNEYNTYNKIDPSELKEDAPADAKDAAPAAE